MDGRPNTPPAVGFVADLAADAIDQYPSAVQLAALQLALLAHLDEQLAREGTLPAPLEGLRTANAAALAVAFHEIEAGPDGSGVIVS